MINLAALRKVIAEATLGPWAESDSDEDVYVYSEPKRCAVADMVVKPSRADASYVATFDPILTSALLDVVEAADGMRAILLAPDKLNDGTYTLEKKVEVQRAYDSALASLLDETEER